MCASLASSSVSGSPNGSVAGGLVAQLLVLQQAVDRVDAVPVRAAVEPEAQRVLHRGHDLGVAPVEVGLLGVERVEVVAPVERLPRRAAEGRDPVVRLLGPDVPVGVLAEPGVLDRGVAGHDVHQHAQARARAPPRSARRTRRGRRRPGPRPCSPTRRSRSPPSATDRSATSRARPPRARRDGRGASGCRPGRRRRRRRNPGTSAGRSGR